MGGCIGIDVGTGRARVGVFVAAGQVVEPAGGKVAEFNAKKHRVFQRLYEDFIACREIMAE